MDPDGSTILGSTETELPYPLTSGVNAEISGATTLADRAAVVYRGGGVLLIYQNHMCGV